jgi:hypothetical protein
MTVTVLCPNILIGWEMVSRYVIGRADFLDPVPYAVFFPYAYEICSIFSLFLFVAYISCRLRQIPKCWIKNILSLLVMIDCFSYFCLYQQKIIFKAHLEHQLTVEKSRMETELKKVKAALESKVIPLISLKIWKCLSLLSVIHIPQ